MIKKIVGIGLLFLTILLLNNKILFPVSVGKLLNPFYGYSSLIGSDNLPSGNIYISALIDTVSVKWDKLRIPHIQAKNELDLYFMQGYIMAFDRLWQMEFQTHAAGGRISEIIGGKGLAFDRFQRRLGMVYGAENTLKELKKNDSLYLLIESFTNGINFYINSINKKKYPLEYKILDYEPELWTPLKTSLLLKSMSWTLTGRTTDLEYTKILNDFGIDIIDELFPIFSSNYDPIIPKNTNFDYKSIIKKEPEKIYRSKNYKLNTSNNKNSSIGSNNWVISGKRAKNQIPILANDPHLQLSLPSIWYLMHLQCPTINVMGVTIPGAPGIIIGFNENISWGVTNGYDDSMDWYDITFYDNNKTEYYYDNQWISTDQIIEEIKIKNQNSFYDTIIYTHHGPVVWDNHYNKNLTDFINTNSSGIALRWIAHDPSNELLSFYLLNKASNYSEFKKSLETYICPGQNFVYSDIHGDIAALHSGKSPVKFYRQGMFISDGSDPYYDWKNYIPFEHRPHILNPLKGYLSSANQNPTDENYPYYLSEYFAPSYRANQINIRLDTLYRATINDMIDIQLDNTYLFAKHTLPILLNIVDESLEEDTLNIFLDILKNWDYTYNGESIAPTFFESWINELENITWRNTFKGNNTEYIWPEINKLEELIVNNPDSKWFDNKDTPKMETLIDVCNESFNITKTKLIKKIFPDTDMEMLEWQNYRGTDIFHLANIPAFSQLDLKTSGAENIINATRKKEGPSWRYIIEMGDPYEIKGIYPGGQSGYPGSFYYDNFINDWVDGKYYDLLFPNNNDEFNGNEIKCIPN